MTFGEFVNRVQFPYTKHVHQASSVQSSSWLTIKSDMISILCELEISSSPVRAHVVTYQTHH